MLGISIYDIRAAKAAGSPAFRGNRIRAKELVDWLREQKTQKAVAPTDDRIGRISAVGKVIVGLKECLDLKLIRDQTFIEAGTAVIWPIINELKGSQDGEPLLRNWATNIVTFFSNKKLKTVNGWFKHYPNLCAFLARVAPPECAEKARKELA